MKTNSIASRLASGNLQQHLHSSVSVVAEACKGYGAFCNISVQDCCAPYRCRWIPPTALSSCH
ncbi:hypothetical protein [Amycolatopsis alba]|uniref:hypothetical protein n=1 Tax=Amycolatopsis alba TaxID=76020 RepID=UPI00035E5E05|nr:hypothetical protein [Amycolatopsis alba]